MKRFLLALFLVSLVSLSFFAGKVYAVNPIPGYKVPCTDTRDNEFNSLRPYQASPCGDSPKAYFCANQVIIYEGFHSTEKCEGLCPVDIFQPEKEYAVEISNTELPIYGNTENVKNVTNSGDEFDDAQKLNEYVSWYLSGVSGRAEYGEVTADQLINYSGPLKKLLPQVIQEAQRIRTIESVSTDTTYTDSESSPDSSTEIVEKGNHNQIVVCESGGKAVPCPEGTKMRLNDWNSGDLSIFNTFFNWLGTDIWNKKYPPLPWQFKENILYQKAYNEWKGKSCAILPVVGLVCVDIAAGGVADVVPNKWSDLYQYVPLANSSDKNAKMPIGGVQIQALGGAEIDIQDPKYAILQEPINMFAHTQEDSENLSQLKQTYLPIVCDKNGKCEELKGSVDENVETGLNEKGECNLIDVRSNPGDNLFTEHPPSEMRIKVTSYNVTQLMCDEEIFENIKDANGNIIGRRPTGFFKCSGSVQILIRSDGKHPFATEVWNSAVAETTSVFRKTYPKVAANAPVSCIADIPGVSNATYTPTEGTDEITVRDPSGKRVDPENAQLFFPHIGGVYDYFLKGIQTALRPQGYGETVTSGLFCKPQTPKECEVDVPDSAVSSKLLGSFKANFIDLADRWSQKCPGPDFNLAEECYNYVASQAPKKGVNAAFALTIWLNESGASNYCEGGRTTQDFGINLPSLYQNFIGQLKAFLGMATQKLCSGVPGFSEPMHGWLSRFQSSAGVCDPKDTVATQYYYDVRDTTWSWITGCSKGGKFGITWPTDTNCP